MDRIFVRNFTLFVLILLVCAGSLIFGLLSGDKEINRDDNLLLHTYDVITEAEKLTTQLEGMLSAQRGHLLTNTEEFLKEYEFKKTAVSNRIARLSELTKNDPSQQSRLDELRSFFTDFSKELEERTAKNKPFPNPDILRDVEKVDRLKNNILRINAEIMEEEYARLNSRFFQIDRKKDEYFKTLLIGILVGTALLLIFNGFLLNAQRKRSRAEASLRDTEERFSLAIDGTEDGIFDWNIEGGQVFYSRRFFEMLGHDQNAFIGTIENFDQLVHPEDKEQVWEQVNQYLNGEVSEYSQIFRMKHASGHWVWIQSRAKALFDAFGKPYRMVGAHTDITSIMKTQEKLEAEKKQAEKANRAKSDFLAHMSHEIRTPLTAISGIAEIFLKTKSDFNEKQRNLIYTLSSSTMALKDLINDILDFSKIESGELELDEAVFTIDEVFENIISMMSLRASEKGISFLFDYSDIKNTRLNGDAKRIRQILVNLINNGIKFTDQGGVTVKVVIDEEESGEKLLRVRVTDTGVGIDPDKFDLVFKRFKQADSSVSRKYGGTGLGLPISLNLAKLMGGDIFLQSEPGRGSTFTLSLPARIMDEGEAQEEPIARKKEKRTAPAAANDSGSDAQSDEKKVLVVEDYEGNVVVLSYILEEIGAKFDVAITGAEAVEKWEKSHYDVILMDVQMPEMDGFTATKTIRHIEKENQKKPTPIIGMTAHALVGDKDKCIEAGMDAYLPKPIVEADLRREILKYL